MIAVVIGVLAVLVVAAIIWARVGAARSENRSVETYEHALGVLGEVSKRTESTGFRILPHEETGRPHVGRRIDPLTGEVSEVPPETGRLEQGPAAPRRLPPAGEPKLRLSGPNRPGGGALPPEGRPEQAEDEPVPAVPPVAAQAQFRPMQRAVTGAADAKARVAAYQSADSRRRQVMARRTATGATAAVALAAVVVAGVYLAGSHGGGGRNRGNTTTTTRSSGGGGTGRVTSTTHTTTTTSSTLPTTLKPTSLSPVTFRVPSSDYTLAFQVSGGPCWVGIEHTSAGPWLFAETLSAGQSASYKATGSLIVTLGAPSHFALSVDGLSAQLPAATQAYSFDLVPTAG